MTEALPETPRRNGVVLAASELATNVIRHAPGPYTVRIEVRHDVIRLEVSDSSSSIVPALDDLADSQRGLRIIDAVSEKWGIEGNENGKTALAEFASGA